MAVLDLQFYCCCSSFKLLHWFGLHGESSSSTWHKYSNLPNLRKCWARSSEADKFTDKQANNRCLKQSLFSSADICVWEQSECGCVGIKLSVLRHPWVSVILICDDKLMTQNMRLRSLMFPSVYCSLKFSLIFTQLELRSQKSSPTPLKGKEALTFAVKNVCFI